MEIKVGDTVETVYGESGKVLSIEERDVKKKKGKVIQEPSTWYTIKFDYGNNSTRNVVQFSKDKLKGHAKPELEAVVVAKRAYDEARDAFRKVNGK